MILPRLVAPTKRDTEHIGGLHCLPFSAYWVAFKLKDRVYFITDEPYWDTIV